MVIGHELQTSRWPGFWGAGQLKEIMSTYQELIQQGLQKGEKRGQLALLKKLVAEGRLTQQQADAMLQQPLKVLS